VERRQCLQVIANATAPTPVSWKIYRARIAKVRPAVPVWPSRRKRRAAAAVAPCQRDSSCRRHAAPWNRSVKQAHTHTHTHLHLRDTEPANARH